MLQDPWYIEGTSFWLRRVHYHWYRLFAKFSGQMQANYTNKQALLVMLHEMRYFEAYRFDEVFL